MLCWICYFLSWFACHQFNIHTYDHIVILQRLCLEQDTSLPSQDYERTNAKELLNSMLYYKQMLQNYDEPTDMMAHEEFTLPITYKW